MEIRLRTLTPLWTGGVEQTTDRLHETGIIGSLRWWYEALVRGLGGYACDPTSDDPNARCSFDAKAYEKAKAGGRTRSEAISEGLRTVCPVCYLFGATGWARLFQLRGVDIPMTPLHFRTTLPMNGGWLQRVFGGKQGNIDSLKVPYGDLRFQFITRRWDEGYARNQFALALRVAADYGGIGARLQHGFGQVVFPPELSSISIAEGLAELKAKIRSSHLRSSGPAVKTPFNLSRFVTQTYYVPESDLSAFKTKEAHIGNSKKRAETHYLPCAFDLRYKGADKLGMRRWLKEEKGWHESNDPAKLAELDQLLGPRSQWGPRGKVKRIKEEQRRASSVFFSMPYLKDSDTYVIRLWAFLPLELEDNSFGVSELADLCAEYMRYVFNVEPEPTTFGKDILGCVQGVEQ